ncbi:MAG: ankyrin repeat domain-containing protein [Mycobacterium sp.]|nr:ankyrin repeat domain-containing protein [Mycobacterium sp.]
MMVDEFGRTPLHYAAADPATVMTHRAPRDVDATGNQDRTALHFAAQAAEPEVVARLLDAGGEVDAVTATGHPSDLLGNQSQVRKPHGHNTTPPAPEAPTRRRKRSHLLRPPQHAPHCATGIE